ncbi:MAG: hypothetical protein JSW67_10220 [Candidatus Latescibacterota bacterium]|nr:MAG: hypothetical protein JSW67_10220 [Candidatus Latescibacterota bacterium]
MTSRRFEALIGLALRTRSAALGRHACRRAAERRTLHALVVARDAGASAVRDGGVPEDVPQVRVDLDKRQLGMLVGRTELALLGITEPHLAAGLIESVAE